MQPLPERLVLTEVTGIDHIYITVSELGRSEPFYDRVLRDALGFRKNAFALGGDPHIQYFNRLFGVVLRPARVQQRARFVCTGAAPFLPARRLRRGRARGGAGLASLRHRRPPTPASIRNTRTTTARHSSRIRTACDWKLRTGASSAASVRHTGTTSHGVSAAVPVPSTSRLSVSRSTHVESTRPSLPAVIPDANRPPAPGRIRPARFRAAGRANRRQHRDLRHDAAGLHPRHDLRGPLSRPGRT